LCHTETLGKESKHQEKQHMGTVENSDVCACICARETNTHNAQYLCAAQMFLQAPGGMIIRAM